MRHSIFLIVLILFFSCEKPKGITVQHAPDWKTTTIEFETFVLHSYTNDSLFRNCGYGLIIEPEDSSVYYDLEATGARLLRNSTDNFRFVIVAIKPEVTLTIINGEKKDILTFKSPFLPNPILLHEKVDGQDYVYLQIHHWADYKIYSLWRDEFYLSYI